MDSKDCKECGINKTLDGYTKCRRGKLGVRAVCKDCVNSKRRIEDAEKRKDPEYRAKKKIADAIYYQKNSEHIKAKVAAYKPGYRELNKDKIKATDALYRKNNKEAIKLANQKWSKENPEMLRAKNHRRRAREAGVHIGEHFTILDLAERDGMACHWCGIETTLEDYFNSKPDYATVDHVIPFVMQGAHDIDNSVIACYRCNVLKGQKSPEEWSQIINK